MSNKRLSGLLALIAVALLAMAALPLAVTDAQGNVPPSFNDALADLGRRIGRTLTLADFNNRSSRWEWRGIDFADNTFECPNPGETVVPGRVIGYQFIFIYRGIRYDYRVAVNDPSTLRLCTNANAGAQYVLTPLPTNTPFGDEPPAVLNDALADLGRRLNLNLTLADFDNPRSRYTWRYREFRNSQLECPSPGQQTDGVFTDGWVITFVYERVTYEYRAKLNDPSSLFLCRGEGLVPRPSPTPRPTATPRL